MEPTSESMGRCISANKRLVVGARNRCERRPCRRGIFVGNILANGKGDPDGADLIFLAVSVSACCYWRLAARMRERNPPQR
jgi:hypothetical protein